MARIDSLQTMLVQELRDLYDAEQRLTRAIPKLAKVASNDDLSDALDQHLAQTREHVARLEEVFETLGQPARGKACAGMRGILEEGDEHMREDFADRSLRDAMIIGSAQRVEHYEIAAYGTAIAHARQLGLDGVIDKLQQTLTEEKEADKKLTEIAEGAVNLEASAEGNGEDRTGRSAGGRAMAARGNGRAASSSRGSRSGQASRGRSSSRNGSTRTARRR